MSLVAFKNIPLSPAYLAAKEELATTGDSVESEARKVEKLRAAVTTAIASAKDPVRTAERYAQDVFSNVQFEKLNSEETVRSIMLAGVAGAKKASPNNGAGKLAKSIAKATLDETVTSKELREILSKTPAALSAFENPRMFGFVLDALPLTAEAKQAAGEPVAQHMKDAESARCQSAEKIAKKLVLANQKNDGRPNLILSDIDADSLATKCRSGVCYLSFHLLGDKPGTERGSGNGTALELLKTFSNYARLSFVLVGTPSEEP